MALKEADKAQLLENGFVHAGNSYARCLACGHNIYLGDPEKVDPSLEHRSHCPWR
ncbi:hypothetical protein MNVI_04060 [Mycobacterium noviomagense]|uniref:Uncharacterized protein n=1 Tax=Mycobacterium noviomagense TaxID=459858 RepID=A0A7I7P931_9MYCO|nr:hypothetical protein MNVI_04060 [Mycobacterium noviomagense]